MLDIPADTLPNNNAWHAGVVHYNFLLTRCLCKVNEIFSGQVLQHSEADDKVLALLFLSDTTTLVLGGVGGSIV